MKSNPVKAALARGETSFGAWLMLPSPFTARLISRLGFDWLMVDTEHAPIDLTLMTEMVGAIADGSNTAPIVRVPSNSVENIKRALDSGAWGVLVPMVNTRQEAEAVVEAALYPPEGKRSIGGAFAAIGFDTADRLEYYHKANREILVAIQLESREAVENCEEILAVPGIDVAFIGPNDLHASLGLTPRNESDEPLFLAALERIKAAAAQHNIPLGMFTSGGEASRKRAEEGFRFISTTSDIASLQLGLTQHLEQAREQVPPSGVASATTTSTY